jgi:hypothetical protein
MAGPTSLLPWPKGGGHLPAALLAISAARGSDIVLPCCFKSCPALPRRGSRTVKTLIPMRIFWLQVLALKY